MGEVLGICFLLVIAAIIYMIVTAPDPAIRQHHHLFVYRDEHHGGQIRDFYGVYDSLREAEAALPEASYEQFAYVAVFMADERKTWITVRRYHYSPYDLVNRINDLRWTPGAFNWYIDLQGEYRLLRAVRPQEYE